MYNGAFTGATLIQTIVCTTKNKELSKLQASGHDHWTS